MLGGPVPAQRRRPWTGLAVAAIVLALGVGSVAVWIAHDRRSDRSASEPSSPASSSPQASASPQASSTRTPVVGERVLTRVYTTGYTWFDNTPPGSALISHPRVHRRAGGTGTYDDPITLAVGHSLASGTDVLDLPAGTRVYVPHVRRYFVVEDTCGDGAAPQRHGCHDLSDAPDGTSLWIDLYVGGDRGSDRTDVQQCAGRVTDGDTSLHTIVLHPGRDHPVAAHPLFHDGECTDLFPADDVTAGR
jgi:3D (Asp-Asp-Asp) domain-containing protein